MAVITIEVPDDITEHFETPDEIHRVLYEDFIVLQRQQGNLSLGRAAELLGITYTEFFDLLGKKGLSFVNSTSDETEESYQRFKNIMTQSGK